MKTILVVCGLLVATVASAAPSKFTLSGRLERTWKERESNSLQHVFEKNTDVAGSIIAGLELSPGIQAIGRVTQPFNTERTEYAIGVEVKILGAGSARRK